MILLLSEQDLRAIKRSLFWNVHIGFANVGIIEVTMKCLFSIDFVNPINTTISNSNF